MILADTSAWVEFLRGTRGAIARRLSQMIAHDAPLATTDVVVMELLAGARSAADRDELRRLLLRCTFLPVRGSADYEDAAEVFRRCRSKGETVRKLTDCLIAVVAMRTDAELLHRDGDFDTIARHTALRLA